MEPIINKTKPKFLQVDKGTEFYNKTFQDMLKSHMWLFLVLIPIKGINSRKI